MQIRCSRDLAADWSPQLSRRPLRAFMLHAPRSRLQRVSYPASESKNSHSLSHDHSVRKRSTTSTSTSYDSIVPSSHQRFHSEESQPKGTRAHIPTQPQAPLTLRPRGASMLANHKTRPRPARQSSSPPLPTCTRSRLPPPSQTVLLFVCCWSCVGAS